jgi:hypothetical protein
MNSGFIEPPPRLSLWQLTDTGIGTAASARLRIVRPGSIRMTIL